MKTIEEKTTELKRLYNLARLAGKVNTQKEFADFVGKSKDTISKALKGNPLYTTDALIEHVTHVLKDNAISITTDTPVIITGSNNATATGDNSNAQVTPSTELLQEMKAQREMYDRHIMQLLKIIEGFSK